MKTRKRFLLAAAVFLCAGAATEVSALGIGAQWNTSFYSSGYGGYPSITFKLDSPWIFAANGYIFSDSAGFGITADNWITNPSLGGPLSWFLGWGIYGDLYLGNPTKLGAGLRIPTGLRLMLASDSLEFYLQAAAQLGVQTHGSLVAWNVPVAIGFRIWF